jgi:hypothetical protein
MPDQLKPHRLTDDELLQWLVVEAYQQMQERGGVRLLLRPWPPCPVCGVRATSRTTSTSPATFDTTMILKPCSHALVASDFAVAALWPAAQATAEQVANVEAVIGPAVEHTTAKKPSANNPFALLLDQFTANAVQASRAKRDDRSDEARTAHQTIAAIWTQAAHLLSQTIKQAHDTSAEGAANRRRRALYATTLREHGMVHLGDQVPTDEYDCCASAVLAVRDEELERLEALHEAHLCVEQRLAREGLESERRGEALKRAHIALAEQAGKDQAALARARALAADMRTWCSPHNLAVEYADRIEEALMGSNSPGDDTTPADEGAADRRYWNGRYDQEGS